MDTNFYDVVVCGGEVAGLVAASLLARRGFRVLVLGHEGERATFEAGGVTLSRAPALLPPLDEPPTARVLKELDCVALVKRRAPGIRPAFRVVLPGQQIDFPVEPAALTRELLRGFGPAAATVAAAIERLDAHGTDASNPLLASAITLPPSGFWERREVARFESLLPKRGHNPFAPLPAEHPFRTMAATPAAANASLIPHEIGPVTEARALALARQGQHVLEGGLAGLQELLLGRIETFGGDRRERLTPVAVVTRRGRAVGIRVQPRDETIGCHHLIWAGAPASLDQAMGAAAPAVTAAADRRLSVRRRPARPGRRRRARDTPVDLRGGRSLAPAARGQRAGDHRRSTGRPNGRPDAHLDRVRRAGQPGRGGAELPRRAARAGHPHAQAADPVAGGQTPPDRFAARRPSGRRFRRRPGAGASHGQVAGHAAAPRRCRRPSTRLPAPAPFDAMAGSRTPPGSRASTWRAARTCPGSASRGSWSPAWGVAHLISRPGKTRRHPWPAAGGSLLGRGSLSEASPALARRSAARRQ